jgi:hypothetical protein
MLDNDFYGEPILLEPEAGNDFVGVRIQLRGNSLTASFITLGFDELAIATFDGRRFPREWLWKYRSARSASSCTTQFSSIIGRLHQAIRHSFPVPEARRATARLLAIHCALGHNCSVLTRSVERLAKQYKSVFARPFYDQLMTALRHDDIASLVSLGAS